MGNLLTVALNRFISRSLALLTAIVLLAPCAAQATPYIVTLTQQGSNVVASGSGAIDLTGLTFYGIFTNVNAVIPSVGYVGTGPNAATLGGYEGALGPASFGSSSSQESSTTVTGDAVAFNAKVFGFPVVFVPSAYVTDTALTSGATWDNTSFASLGVTPGTYTWTWGREADQSFTLMIRGSVTAVPEPAVLGMFGLGVLLLGGFVTLHRREQWQA